MFSLIRTTVKLTLLFLLSLAALSCFAGTASVKPFAKTTLQNTYIRAMDTLLAARVEIISVSPLSDHAAIETTQSGGRICSCQILNLESANYDHRYVVLLAEKTNDGSSVAYKIARNRIQKEKKQLRHMFYDKVKVVAEMQGAVSCKSMFIQLRSTDSKLKLYEILNADIN